MNFHDKVIEEQEEREERDQINNSKSIKKL